NHPYLFSQIFHEKKMINGAVQPVGYTDSLFVPIRRYPLSLLNCDYQKTAKEEANPSRWLTDLRSYLIGQNVRYIIWHKDLPDLDGTCPVVVERTRKLLNNGNIIKEVYEDNEISAFAVN
ncbi:MAG: hypothetical protein Q8N81_08540, partial [bacterium]|nr:hypothetical protein [bacterium]